MALLRIRRFGGGDLRRAAAWRPAGGGAEEVVGSPEDFRALLVGENVTVLTQTPSAAAVLSPEGLESVALLMAGEPCPVELVQRWAPGG
ncbi:linear gramicidin synthetase subunit D domain protein [Mycobacterium xenopi 4042]|uniref:Linear gramicidin synthetase subunit D domain protein n=1 Tax=Mycobacterium xenopi 4042 TaxID=1299334 RepID=X8CKH5_MYCXE|nr:linear gramicidin synthetase subunit D domain protein [Mycobacterium xenopi 4042]